MNKIFLGAIIIFGSIFLLVIALGVYKFNFTDDDIYFTACTEEAKLCPDGSAVGRSGPKCEFAVCPERVFEETGKMSEFEARTIAEKSCIKGGESLRPGYFNKYSKTWWFDANLNATREGCFPACVVSEATKSAEISWRCPAEMLPQ